MSREKTNSSEVKERILDVARDLFIRKGYKGTGIRDIAAASDTNVAMVNYYFHSKYNLFEIIFEEAFGHLQKKVFSTLASDMPFFELVETIICSYYDMLIEYPQIPIFIINEINQDPVRLSARLQTRDPYGAFMKMAARIREEEAKGTIGATPPVDFLLNLLSLCIFPFVFRNLGMNVANVSQRTYTEMLENHKHYVIGFVINALKKY
jgi:AcrR family transcriptional regulator